MNNLGLTSELRRLRFTKAGDILLKDRNLEFRLSASLDASGFVYVWVEVSSSAKTIVYVGKAGRGLHTRCKQHAGGFRNSTTGRGLAARLRSGIGEGRRYEVHARKSELATILGEKGISMACAEELALIQKYDPAWNVLKPSVRSQGKAA